MKRGQYMGMDVHQATTVVAVMDQDGKMILETIVETQPAPLVRLMQSMSGPLYATLEETTQAEWLYQLLEAHCAELIVCDPRRNKLLSEGSKADKSDARKLADLLRTGMLRSVYHGHQQTQRLKELVRGYETVSEDTQRVMVRIKAVFRGRGIATSGHGVYQPGQRRQWMDQLQEDGIRQRASWLYEQLDQLQPLRRRARQAMLAEAQQHQAVRLLCSIPQLGPIRSAKIVATVKTPFRFRTRKQIWAYSGLAVVTHSSSEYQIKDGQLTRARKPVATRGLNRNCNHRMKEVFIAAATGGSRIEPYRSYVQALQNRGTSAEMSRICLARKISAIALTIWKKGEKFDPRKLNWST
jgi:transposase